MLVFINTEWGWSKYNKRQSMYTRLQWSKLYWTKYLPKPFFSSVLVNFLNRTLEPSQCQPFWLSHSQLSLGCVLFLKQGIPQAAALFYRSGAVLSDVFSHISGLSTACVEHRLMFVVGRYEVQCWVSLQTLGENKWKLNGLTVPWHMPKFGTLWPPAE